MGKIKFTNLIIDLILCKSMNYNEFIVFSFFVYLYGMLKCNTNIKVIFFGEKNSKIKKIEILNFKI